MDNQIIHIEFDDARILASLGKLMATLTDPSKVMANIADDLEKSTRGRFDSQTGPDGTPWIQSLRARITNTKTLIQSRHLLDSVASDSGRDYAAVGVNRIYAAIQQFGGTITAKTAKGLRFRLASGDFAIVRSVTLPARPYLGVSQKDENKILLRIEAAINGAVNAG